MFKLLRSIIIPAALLLLVCSPMVGKYNTVEVDFLAKLGVNVNGAGPLLTACDATRDRIILVNTNTSSITIIHPSTPHTPSAGLVNIPVASRVPQFLKSEALCIDKKTGNIYVIGNKSLHIIFPAKNESISLDTGEQYEMVAVHEPTGVAFLVSGASRYMLRVDPSTRTMKKIKWVDSVKSMGNLNQTPPPPVRKIVCDNTLDRVIAFDGCKSMLSIFSTTSGKLIKQRVVKTAAGARWHFAGYHPGSHYLYLVVETAERKVIQAVKIDTRKEADVIVPLPGLTEGVGVNYNPQRDEVYIPYDNHPSLHIVDFKLASKRHGAHAQEPEVVSEVKLPSYGNDATALDIKNNILYVSSWAWGEIDVIDLESKHLKKRLRNIGIIPHMFNMTFLPNINKLFIPLGATAVNGSFGSALTQLDPGTGKQEKIHTGWAPVECIPLPGQDSAIVFNSEDSYALVQPDGTYSTHKLPFDYPHDAVLSKSNNINLAYGPHQSYWPTVYIWAAQNGILTIAPQSFAYNYRRTPRLAHRIVQTQDGSLYGLQNNWGQEKQFLFAFPDDVRSPNLGDQRVELDNTVMRETTQRLLAYDPGFKRLYIAGTGEKDDDPGLLQIFDLETKKVVLKYPTGRTPTDLVFDEKYIYIANFDSDTVTIINKDDFSVRKITTGSKPFKLATHNQTLYIINHNDNTLQTINEKGSQQYPLPYPGKPDNLYKTRNPNNPVLIITSHTADTLRVLEFSLGNATFQLIHQFDYPFGEATVDTNNSAFYVRGQFSDAIFEINRIREDEKGRLWITDYLSGKLFHLVKK